MEHFEATSRPTYHRNRRCLYCNRPIADQEHKLRKHCLREVMPDGSIKCCKDDRHSEIKSKVNRPYLAIIKHHKNMTESIAILLREKGVIASLTDINNAGIILQKPLAFDVINGQYIFYFQGFKIAQIDKNQYEIEKNG